MFSKSSLACKTGVAEEPHFCRHRCVQGISSITFGHGLSQAPRTPSPFKARLVERGLDLILIWGFLWTWCFLALPHALKKKSAYFKSKEHFWKRFSTDINIHPYGSTEDCKIYTGLRELIKCLQYEKCAFNK